MLLPQKTSSKHWAHLLLGSLGAPGIGGLAGRAWTSLGAPTPWGRLESPDCSGSWGGLFEAPARSQAGQAALKGLRAGLVSGLGVMEAFPRKQAR